MARRVRRLHGACAAIARLAGCSRGYVWDVVHFRKPPSEKLKRAISAYMDREGELMQIDAVRLEVEPAEPVAQVAAAR